MKNKLLALAAVCAVSTGAQAADLAGRAKAPAAPVAVQNFDAFASVGVGYNWANGEVTGLPSSDFNGLALDARATFFAPITGTFGFQADGGFERNANKIGFVGVSDDLVRTSGSLAAHVFSRNTTGLVGVFAQGNAGSINLPILPTNDRRYLLGAEGQYFLGNSTLYGQLAYQNLSYADFFTAKLTGDAVNVSAQFRHFLSSNLLVAVKGDYENMNLSGSVDFLGSAKADVQSWRGGALAEYRFDASPVSLYGDVSYRWTDAKLNDISGTYKETETRALVGLKLNFGSKTLFERDRSGASLDPIKPVNLIFGSIGGNT